eukprot:127633_1
MDCVANGLTYLYKAYQDKPHNNTYEETFKYYKNYNQNPQDLQTAASVKCAESSGSSIPNHLEVTDITQKMQCTYIQPRIKKKRQDPPLRPPPSMMCPPYTPTDTPADTGYTLQDHHTQPLNVLQTVIGT